MSINSHKMRMGKHEHTWWTVKIRSAPVPAGHKRELKVASVTRRSTDLWIINLMFLASLGCVAGCLSMEVKRMGDSEGKILYRKEALAGKGGGGGTHHSRSTTYIPPLAGHGHVYSK